MSELEGRLRRHLQAALEDGRALSSFAGALAHEPLTAVPRRTSPRRLEDPAKGWGQPVEASRAELALLLGEAMAAHKDAVLLVEDRRSKKSDPWVARYGVDTTHLFVDEALLVFAARADRPSTEQLKAALCFGDASATVVGVVVAAHPDLLDLEEEDISRGELERLVLAPPLALFAAAFGGEGFLLVGLQAASSVGSSRE